MTKTSAAQNMQNAKPCLYLLGLFPRVRLYRTRPARSPTLLRSTPATPALRDPAALAVLFGFMAAAWKSANVMVALGFTANTMPAWQWSFGLSRAVSV